MTRAPVNDHWTLDIDSFGAEPVGKGLVRQVLTCDPPFAICVQGKWGSGKTSLMRYAMASLGGQPIKVALGASSTIEDELPPWLDARWKELSKDAQSKNRHILSQLVRDSDKGILARNPPVVRCIWFNPWQHRDGTPIVALLQEICAQFSWWQRTTTKAKKLGEVTVEAGLSLLNELIAAFTSVPFSPKDSSALSVKDVRALGERWEQTHFAVQSDAQRLNLMFEKAVRRLLGTPERPVHDDEDLPICTHRLVVFIDDLDRCNEAHSMQLVEAIKLYFQTPNCVFVCGVDTYALRRAVLRTVSGADGELAREYVEKLFQATISVPTACKVHAFLSEMIQRVDLDQTMLPEIEALVEPNPRKIKNFLNNAAFAWQLYDSHKRPDPLAFLLVQYLRSYHPEVTRLLTYDPDSNLDHLKEVLGQIEGGREPDSEVDPVRLVFYRSFRHTRRDRRRPIEGVEPPKDKRPERKALDEVVDEVIARMDRHRTDGRFIELWAKLFSKTYGDSISAGRGGTRFEPLAHLRRILRMEKD